MTLQVPLVDDTPHVLSGRRRGLHRMRRDVRWGVEGRRTDRERFLEPTLMDETTCQGRAWPS